MRLILWASTNQRSHLTGRLLLFVVLLLAMLCKRELHKLRSLRISWMPRSVSPRKTSVPLHFKFRVQPESFSLRIQRGAMNGIPEWVLNSLPIIPLISFHIALSYSLSHCPFTLPWMLFNSEPFSQGVDFTVFATICQRIRQRWIWRGIMKGYYGAIFWIYIVDPHYDLNDSKLTLKYFQSPMDTESSGCRDPHKVVRYYLNSPKANSKLL